MSKNQRYELDPPPAWFPVAVAARYSGLSRALIYEHIQDGAIVSSTVKRPGCRRGRRLIQRESLDKLIEKGIGQNSADNTGKNRLLGNEKGGSL